MEQPLAIFGGTFDPVHVGHLRAAWEASEALDAEVRMVPASVPPHRPQPVADAERRVAMLRTALAGQDRLGLDLRELSRRGPSYTFDTLASLRAEIGGSRPLVLLVGADAFAGLSTWHRWQELFELAHICVLTRPGQIPAVPEVLAAVVASRAAVSAETLRSTPAGRVLNVAVTALGISSTRIRNMLAAGRQPRWLVPQALLEAPELLAAYRDAPVARPGGDDGSGSPPLDAGLR